MLNRPARRKSFQRARAQPVEDALLGRVEARVERSASSRCAAGSRSILHQRDQRRDHDGQPVEEQRRKPVAEALPRPGREDRERRPPARSASTTSAAPAGTRRTRTWRRAARADGLPPVRGRAFRQATPAARPARRREEVTTVTAETESTLPVVRSCARGPGRGCSGRSSSAASSARSRGLERPRRAGAGPGRRSARTWRLLLLGYFGAARERLLPATFRPCSVPDWRRADDVLDLPGQLLDMARARERRLLAAYALASIACFGPYLATALTRRVRLG